jgi:hypothetical protein
MSERPNKPRISRYRLALPPIFEVMETLSIDKSGLFRLLFRKKVMFISLLSLRLDL